MGLDSVHSLEVWDCHVWYNCISNISAKRTTANQHVWRILFEQDALHKQSVLLGAQKSCTWRLAEQNARALRSVLDRCTHVLKIYDANLDLHAHLLREVPTAGTGNIVPNVKPHAIAHTPIFPQVTLHGRRRILQISFLVGWFCFLECEFGTTSMPGRSVSI